MLDSMDSLVDRNESPSEPFPGYVPQTAPAKTALPPNGKIFIKFFYSKDLMFYFSSFITDFFTIYFIFLENRLHGSPTKKMPDAIPEEAESETGSHLNVQGVLAS